MTMQGRQLGAVWLATVAGRLLSATMKQVGQILPYNDCAHGNRWTMVMVLAAAALVLLSGGICWIDRSLDCTSRFTCGVDSLLALVVAFCHAAAVHGWLYALRLRAMKRALRWS
jgi:spore maturation protein SpmA